MDAALERVAAHIDRVELRAGLQSGMAAAAAVNAYLNATEPWKAARDDPERARVILGTALSAVSGIRVCLSPYLPFSNASLDGILGPVQGWCRAEVEPGRRIDRPSPLFAKVDPTILDGLVDGELG